MVHANQSSFSEGVYGAGVLVAWHACAAPDTFLCRLWQTPQFNPNLPYTPAVGHHQSVMNGGAPSTCLRLPRRCVCVEVASKLGC